MASLPIVITDVGLNLLRNALKGAVNPVVKYVALGSSSTVPATTDTKLGTEIFRKAVTSYTNGATGEIFINMFLAQSDLVGATISEIGFFGGASAKSTPNSGILLAHGQYSHTHAVETITFVLDFTISVL